jgi:hypothetical protein
MENKEFFFRGYPAGKFLDEWHPDKPGILKYEPYRGPGHFDMQEELKKTGFAQCYCDTEQGRHFFEVRKDTKIGSLAISKFSLSKLPEDNLVKWLEPWVPTGLGAEKELEKEVGAGHVLFQRKCTPIARRIDRDEILFLVQNSDGLHAAVHLTWSGKKELDTHFPKTILYQKLEDWLVKMKKDHVEYML